MMCMSVRWCGRTEDINGTNVITLRPALPASETEPQEEQNSRNEEQTENTEPDQQRTVHVVPAPRSMGFFTVASQ